MVEAQRGLIEIEVVYASPQQLTVITLAVPVGTTVSEALARSGIAAKHPEVDWSAVAVGIFGRRVPATTALDGHDRIEIYRPLIADPKLVRRMRARKTGKLKR